MRNISTYIFCVYAFNAFQVTTMQTGLDHCQTLEF